MRVELQELAAIKNYSLYPQAMMMHFAVNGKLKSARLALWSWAVMLARVHSEEPDIMHLKD